MTNLDNYKSRDLIPIKCEKCAKTFYRTKHQLQKSIRLNRKVYCSTECLKSFHYKNCKNCNKEFEAKSKNQIFCGKSCAASYNNSNSKPRNPQGINGLEDKIKPKRYCLKCGSEINSRNKLFCSQKCNGNYHRKKPPKRNCLFCKNPIKSKKYCSRECQAKYSWQERKSRIDNNDLLKEFKKPSSIKKYMYELKGKSCEICGIKEWMGKEVPLVLDHINGNSDDNSLKNLRLVCGNCDMQLPTYKSKNMGNGRNSKRKLDRRKRYKEGKSY